jgi:hypothetical protein
VRADNPSPFFEQERNVTEINPTTFEVTRTSSLYQMLDSAWIFILEGGQTIGHVGFLKTNVFS